MPTAAVRVPSAAADKHAATGKNNSALERKKGKLELAATQAARGKRRVMTQAATRRLALGKECIFTTPQLLELQHHPGNTRLPESIARFCATSDRRLAANRTMPLIGLALIWLQLHCRSSAPAVTPSKVPRGREMNGGKR